MVEDGTEARPYFGDLSSTGSPPNYASKALEAACVAKTGDGVLFGFTMTNTKAGDQWVQLFDSRTVPADGAVPIFAAKVAAGDARAFLWVPGRSVFAGIVLCNSTTQGTKTAGASDCLFDVQYL